jgi:hypothetical protein
MPAFFLSLPGAISMLGLATLVIHGVLTRRPASAAMAFRTQTATVIMQIVVSLVVLAAAVYVLLATSNADDHKWAYGVIGTIVGYWLRSTT